ncbi:hypothetical protein Tco_1001398, partial [Tanacetum coccineum]
SNMSRANPQAAIVSEEQLVPSANRLIIKKNNQRVASDSNITDTLLKLVVGILKHHKLYKLVCLTATIPMPLPVANKPYTKPPSEKQILAFIKTLGYDEDPKAKMTSISTLSIPQRSNVDMHSEGQDSPLTKMINTVEGYKYYKHKKNERKKDEAAEEPEEQHVSPIRSGKGKGYMRSGNHEVNVPSAFKKNVVPRKQRSKTIVDNIVPQEDLAVELVKSVSIEEQRLQQHDIMTQLTIERQVEKDVEDMYVAERGLKLKDSSCSNINDEKDIEIDDSDESDMDLSDDEPKGDDDATGFGNLLIEPLVHELMNLMSNPVYTDAHTTSAVANPEGNPEVTSYISGASEVPFNTNVGLQATILVLQEIKAVAQKFKEYDQKMEALSSIKVSEANEEIIKKDKAPVVPVQENTPAEQPQDQEDDYVQERPNA